MWPFNQQKSEYLTISLTPQNLVCTLIDKSQNKKNQINIKAHERTTLKHLEFSQSVLFNPTRIKNLITTFIKKNHIKKNILVALSLSGPKIFEKVVQLNSPSPKLQDFTFPELQNLNWSSVYLCPSERDGFDFLICGMKPEYLFSYQLLALSCQLNLKTITTGGHAQLHLYKYLNGTKFRQSQLSLDMISHRYNLNSLVTYDKIINILNTEQIPTVDLQKEYLFLSANLGLFVSEGK